MSQHGLLSGFQRQVQQDKDNHQPTQRPHPVSLAQTITIHPEASARPTPATSHGRMFTSVLDARIDLAMLDNTHPSVQDESWEVSPPFLTYLVE